MPSQNLLSFLHQFYLIQLEQNVGGSYEHSSEDVENSALTFEQRAAIQVKFCLYLLNGKSEGRFTAQNYTEYYVIQQHIEHGGDMDAEALDEGKLKRMVLAFEKRTTKNQELRIKFPDEPTKFLNSEIELHDAIQGKTNICIWS